MAKKKAIKRVFCFFVILAILMSAMPISIFAMTSNVTNASGKDETFLGTHEDSNVFSHVKAISLTSRTVSEAPKEEWNKTFGSTGDDEAWTVQQTDDGGYILAGDTLFETGLCTAWLVKTNSIGEKEWEQTFRGTGLDSACSVQQTGDGGYILAGDTLFETGLCSAWLLKTNSIGEKEWEQTFRGTGFDSASSVQQTSDGGYILAGNTLFESGLCSAWLVKTNSQGEKEWEKTFGITGFDSVSSVQQTTDGGYILAGDTLSSDAGLTAAWLLKTNSKGEKEWEATFGGIGLDSAYSANQTADGGYILARETLSFYTGLCTAWLVKTNAKGIKEWEKTYGETGLDSAYSVQQTTDGGYIFAGETFALGAYGWTDAWLVKTDSEGNKKWERTFGGSGDDLASAVQQTADGGYVIAGCTDSYGDGYYDAWLIKVKGTGCGKITHWETKCHGIYHPGDRVGAEMEFESLMAGGYNFKGVIIIRSPTGAEYTNSEVEWVPSAPNPHGKFAAGDALYVTIPEGASTGNYAMKLELWNDDTDELCDATEWKEDLFTVEGNKCPVLLDGKVEPQKGSESTNFVFSVTCKDEDGDEPVGKHVRITGFQGTNKVYDETKEMIRGSGDIKMGVTYSYSTTLPAAEFRFYFYFGDGECAAYLPEGGYPGFEGPNVIATNIDVKINTFDVEEVTKYPGDKIKAEACIANEGDTYTFNIEYAIRDSKGAYYIVYDEDLQIKAETSLSFDDELDWTIPSDIAQGECWGRLIVSDPDMQSTYYATEWDYNAFTVREYQEIMYLESPGFESGKLDPWYSTKYSDPYEKCDWINIGVDSEARYEGDYGAYIDIRCSLDAWGRIIQEPVEITPGEKLAVEAKLMYEGDLKDGYAELWLVFLDADKKSLDHVYKNLNFVKS